MPRKSKYTGLTDFCTAHNIDEKWARSKLIHGVKSQEDLLPLWDAGNKGRITLDEFRQGDNNAEIRPEDLNSLDAESLKVIKQQRDITYKDIQIEREKIALAKERAELVPFAELCDLIGAIATITRLEIGSLINKLPARLEGVSADKATIILKQEIEALLVSLSGSIGEKVENLKQK